jgi:hypothetical protein
MILDRFRLTHKAAGRAGSTGNGGVVKPQAPRRGA